MLLSEHLADLFYNDFAGSKMDAERLGKIVSDNWGVLFQATKDNSPSKYIDVIGNYEEGMSCYYSVVASKTTNDKISDRIFDRIFKPL